MWYSLNRMLIVDFICRVHPCSYEESIATFLNFPGATCVQPLSYTPACVRKHFKSGVLNFILDVILQVINRWIITNYTYLITYTHSLTHLITHSLSPSLARSLTRPLTHSLTLPPSTEQSPSSEANQFSRSQIAHILWNLKVH